MTEYKVVSSKPKPRLTADKNNHDKWPNESDCVKEIIEIGVVNVKAISSRSNPKLNFTRLDGPAYLKLWKEYERQVRR